MTYEEAMYLATLCKKYDCTFIQGADHDVVYLGLPDPRDDPGSFPEAYFNEDDETWEIRPENWRDLPENEQFYCSMAHWSDEYDCWISFE